MNSINRKYLLFILISISGIQLFAQSPIIDSLYSALKNAKTEEDRYLTEGALGGELTFVDPTKAIEYSKRAKTYFKKNKDWERLAKCLNSLGISYAISGDYEKSEKEFLEWLQLGTDTKDSAFIARASTSLANIYHSKSQYQKSEQSYLRALRIFQAEKDHKGISTVYSNLGNVYKAQGNYNKALESYLSSLKEGEKIKIEKGTTLTNIGNVFSDMGNHTKAIEYFERAIEDFIKSNKPYYVAWAKSNLASVYFDIGNYEKSESLYREAEKMHKEQQDLEGIANSERAIANIRFKQKKYPQAKELYLSSAEKHKELELNYDYAKVLVDLSILLMEQKKYDEADEYLEEAYTYIELFPYDHELMEMYQTLSEVNKFKGNFEESLVFMEKSLAVKDSIFNSEMTKNFAEKEAKYQNDKKQKENEILKQQNKISELNAEKAEEENLRQKERTKMLVLFGVIGGLLLSIIIFILIRSNRQKHKNNELLKNQNDEISNQNKIIEEKNKDITDSINYAQNIQQAILPDTTTAKNILGESFILFLPRDIVSGDFYWMHKMENGEVFFAVADCTGHGVPGAFMSMMGNDMLNKIIVDHGISEPGKALTELNNEVKKALAKNISSDKMRDGMDIMLCKMNKERNQLSYASAMRSMYHVSKNGMNEYKGDKRAIGGTTDYDFVFNDFMVTIAADDCLYLTTDGFADQFGGTDGKKFMSKNLKDLFIENKREPMEMQCSILKENFNKWRGSFEQVDDVTVLGIRI